MNNLQELKIWKKSMDLAQEVYEACSDLPKDERFGLISQIKRSAVSIPSNISEGAGRNSDKEFVHFLSIAHGSSYELHSQILLSKRLSLLSDEKGDRLLIKISEIQKMNFALQKSIRNW